MSVEEIKQSIESLTPSERNEISTFLRSLRLISDEDYQARVAERLDDKNPENWLSLDEMKRQLGER